MIFLLLVALIVAVLFLVLLFLLAEKSATSYRTEGNVRYISQVPSQWNISILAIKKSLFKRKNTKGIELPAFSLMRKGVSLDAQNIAEYKDICGFSNDDAVPLTYPYLLIFPIQTMLLLDSAFPFPAMGLVHMACKISQFTPLKLHQTVDFSVRFDSKLWPHAKGYCFSVVGEVFDSTTKELLWKSENTYLARAKVSQSAATGALYESSVKPEDVTDLSVNRDWSLRKNFSNSYAAISGDFNPIHMYDITAKLFGFKHGKILHGMWSIGACAALLLPSPPLLGVTTELYIELKLPMYLPASPVLSSKDVELEKGANKSDTSNCVSRKVFEVTVKAKGTKGENVPHLRGTCSVVK